MVLRVSKIQTRWMFVVPTILRSPEPVKERDNVSESFCLWIPGCSASSPMLPIGTSSVGLTCNNEPIGINLRLILESTIQT